jgi:hypothetical protein
MPRCPSPLLALALALCSSQALAQAQPACDPAKAINASKEGMPLLKALVESMGIKGLASDRCRSMAAVLRMATSAKFTAGSPLKTGTGPETAQVTAEIVQLRQNADAARELDALAAQPQTTERAMLEAALFHQHGAYTARDARIAQARQLAGVQ